MPPGSTTIPQESESTANRKVIRHKRSSTKLLKDWFTAHSSHPYPTEQEKEALSQSSGLTVRQVSFWFTNARRRRQDQHNHVSEVATSLPDPVEVPLSLSLEAMTPLDRWRHSPPEDEPGSWSAIADALAGNPLPLDPDLSAPRSGQNSGGSDSQSVHFSRPQSGTSGSSSDLSTRSFGSSVSAASWGLGSVSEFANHKRRRRRRSKRGTTQSTMESPGAAQENRIYQCTFCTDTFKSRYDWTRHEGTLHLVLEKWTCLPFGGLFVHPQDNSVQCALCGQPDPTDSHLQHHDCQQCIVKPLSSRSFYRKDHLRQHLRATHRVNDVLKSMDMWKTKITRVNSRCGFCGEKFQLWGDRNDHLVDHFRAGALMKDWTGCRGLDPGFALLVENAIPPYLIGQQSRDLDPFSASKISQNNASQREPGQRSLPTAFELLTSQLGLFVTSQRAQGLDVSDCSLRRQARLILFEDDDPWNTTPADNNDWLQMFKAGYGLIDDLQMLPAIGNGMFGSTTCLDMDSNRSPFTAERMRQAAVIDFDSMPSGLFGDLSGNSMANAPVPWSWQTPECLAEFSQMSQGTQCPNQDEILHQLDLGKGSMPNADFCPFLDKTWAP